MTKSTTPYWNVLSSQAQERWAPVKGLEGIAEELTLSIDEESGEYTKLTRFLPGADTVAFGGKTHLYPEEGSSSAVASMTKRLKCGWRPDTMPVGLLGNFMGHSRPMSGA